MKLLMDFLSALAILEVVFGEVKAFPFRLNPFLVQREKLYASGWVDSFSVKKIIKSL